MNYEFYVGDTGPIVATITDDEGELITPLSATATIINLHTAEVVSLDEACTVELGKVTWNLTDGHPVSDNASRYVVYLAVQVDANTKKSVPIFVDVLDKGSYLVVDRWRRKVEHAAPNLAALSDQEGRDWVDQAVGVLNRYRNDDYTSTLATITPTPSGSDLELIASLASFLARAGWWAGKGNWRDEEMSFDGTPFDKEWSRLEAKLEVSSLSGWFTDDFTHTTDMYNRDKTDRWGIPDEPDDYFDQVWLQDNRAEL